MNSLVDTGPQVSVLPPIHEETRRFFLICRQWHINSNVRHKISHTQSRNFSSDSYHSRCAQTPPGGRLLASFWFAREYCQWKTSGQRNLYDCTSHPCPGHTHFTITCALHILSSLLNPTLGISGTHTAVQSSMTSHISLVHLAHQTACHLTPYKLEMDFEHMLKLGIIRP